MESDDEPGFAPKNTAIGRWAVFPTKKPGRYERDRAE